MEPRGRSPRPIRVLVVDDSAFMRTAIARMVESDPDMEVVGTARDGLDALEKVASLRPDLLTMDIEMPRMNGLETLQRLMAEHPLPVIVVSSLTQAGAEATLQAFELGAFECIPKELSYASLDIVKVRDELIEKIKAGFQAKIVPRPKHPAQSPLATVPIRPAAPLGPPPAVVAIGASTGGPKALQEVLTGLPSDFPVGIVIVQHMPPGFTGPFAKRLDTLSKISVREARGEEAIEPGTALVAPAGSQMLVQRRTYGTLAVQLSQTPKHPLHTPSVDVMMLSVAEVCGSRSMGVILTGMGCDGAAGIKAIYQKGGITIGQDEATCVVWGMPRACHEAKTLRREVPLQRVAAEMISATAVAHQRV